MHAPRSLSQNSAREDSAGRVLSTFRGSPFWFLITETTKRMLLSFVLILELNAFHAARRQWTQAFVLLFT